MGSYCSTSDVAILAPVLTRGASDFSASTQPTKSQVEKLIQWVFADIQTHLGTVGYVGSAASGTELFGTLTYLNALGAAALAEQTRISDTIGTGERTRAQVLWRMYEQQLSNLAYMDLTRMGLPEDEVVPYAGGTSWADKLQDARNVDVVQPRFKRDMFRIRRISPS